MAIVSLAKEQDLLRKGMIIVGVALVLAGFYAISLYNFLLFHSLTEVFAVVVASGIFMVAWHSRRILDNSYILFLGIAYLFVGGLDLLHLLTYKEMAIFQESSAANLTVQMWLSARFMESGAFLGGFLFLGRPLRPVGVFLVLALIFALLVLTVFYWRVFPTSYIEGIGLTTFKRGGEATIILMLLASIGLLLHSRAQFDRDVLHLMIWSLIMTIVSEIIFMFYYEVYGFLNMLGHQIKIISFLLIYEALVALGLSRPFNVMFRGLKASEEALRQSEERFRLAIKNSPVIIAQSDRDLKYTWIENPHPDFNPDNVLGKRDDELGMEGADRVMDIKSQVLETGQSRREEVSLRSRDGDLYFFDISAEPLRSPLGDVVGVTTVGINVTDRKSWEERTRQLNEDLQRRSEELESFAASVAHDLRSPLRTIQGFATILAKRYSERLNTDGRNYIELIIQASQQMQKLIEDMLTLARLGSKGVKLEPLELRGLLVEVLTALEARIRETEAQIDLDEELPEVRADRMLLKQIFTNLVDNALKYRREDVPPRVAVRGQGSPENITLVVEDNGMGIDPQYHERIFGIFQRLHSQETISGTGIGLALVRKAVDLMGGRVWVESQLGHGSTFYVQLPRR